ncbi:MAG: SDR family NAD(P)-dependent oxidoreductase [Nocardioides sp.]
MNGTGDRLSELVVVVTGAGGGAGPAVVRTLLAEGATVVAVDVAEAALSRLAAEFPGAGESLITAVVDLLEFAETSDFAAKLEAELGHVDGVVHLVGGWRGGTSFADNSLDDWDWLHRLLIRTVQSVSLAFQTALVRAAEAGHESRFVLISAHTVDAPTAGNAGYAAAKAAAETWTLALADELRSHATAAAVVLRVKALLTPAMREAKPEAAFTGYTEVGDLAVSVAGLWSREAAVVNGKRISA